MAFSITNPLTDYTVNRAVGRYDTGNNDTVADTETVAITSLSPGRRSGWVRIQTTPHDPTAATGTITAFKIVATDGVTPYTIAQKAACAAGEALDYSFPFYLDIAATSFTATFTLTDGGGGDPTLTRADIEVYATP